MQAACLRVKLPGLDAGNARRRQQAGQYLEALASTKLVLPSPAPAGEPVWHLFVVQSAERDQLQKTLAAAGIATLIHYPCPPHLQGAYATMGFRRGAFPRAEALADRVLSLPIGWDFDIAGTAASFTKLSRIVVTDTLSASGNSDSNVDATLNLSQSLRGTEQSLSSSF